MLSGLDPNALIVALLSVAGPVGAFVLVRKLPGERALTAVTASEKSVETMQRINDELEKSKEWWKSRAERAEAVLTLHGIPIPPEPPTPPNVRP